MDPVSAARVAQAVEALAADHGTPKLIIVDTLARNLGNGDENSNADIGMFINNIDIHLRSRFGAAVLIVHHTGHLEKDRSRGASSLRQFLPERRALPGAVELLRALRSANVPHGIATSGRRPEIDRSLEILDIGQNTIVVERGDVLRAKPAPDLFLNCQQRLGVSVDECYVVGDAVWDLLAARRARMLCVGLLSGGYGDDELTRAGAFRVYRDPAELHESLDELGVMS